MEQVRCARHCTGTKRTRERKREDSHACSRRRDGVRRRAVSDAHEGADTGL